MYRKPLLDDATFHPTTVNTNNIPIKTSVTVIAGLNLQVCKYRILHLAKRPGLEVKLLPNKAKARARPGRFLKSSAKLFSGLESSVKAEN